MPGGPRRLARSVRAQRGGSADARGDSRSRARVEERVCTLRGMSAQARLFVEGEGGGGLMGATEHAPLAARMRPRTLDDILGQDHLLAADRVLRRALEADR